MSLQSPASYGISEANVGTARVEFFSINDPINDEPSDIHSKTEIGTVWGEILSMQDPINEPSDI